MFTSGFVFFPAGRFRRRHRHPPSVKPRTNSSWWEHLFASPKAPPPPVRALSHRSLAPTAPPSCRPRPMSPTRYRPPSPPPPAPVSPLCHAKACALPISTPLPPELWHPFSPPWPTSTSHPQERRGRGCRGGAGGGDEEGAASAKTAAVRRRVSAEPSRGGPRRREL